MTDSIRRRMALGGMVEDPSEIFDSYLEEKKTWRAMNGNNAKRNGDITEMDFCNAVSKHGWEVFKNISCVGPVDCIVMNTKGKLYKVDVKTVPNLKYAMNIKNEYDNICIGFMYQGRACIQYGKGEDDQIVLKLKEEDK
jgi:hypothetical protein